MFWFIFEWPLFYTFPDRYIFMGMLYIALTVIGLGLLTALLMTLKNLQDHDGGHHEDAVGEAVAEGGH